MTQGPSSLFERVKAGQTAGVARAISVLADRRPGHLELLGDLYRHPVNAEVIGVTGPPGAGKSTLVDSLIENYRAAGKRVGVVAVDPSSPFTGGAILGDRIRMQRHATDPDVFIRSLASRGLLGGLGPATAEAARVLAHAGFDPIIIETVGVGQAEVEVMGVAGLVLMVLVPGSGDVVQCLKAGVMEIGDIFVVNKGDRDGADRLMVEVEVLLRLAWPDESPDKRLLRTVATTGDGIEELIDKLAEHAEEHIAKGERARRLERQMERQLRGLLRSEVVQRFYSYDSEKNAVDKAVKKLSTGQADPVSLAREIADDFSAWLGG